MRFKLLSTSLLKIFGSVKLTHQPQLKSRDSFHFMLMPQNHND